MFSIYFKIIFVSLIYVFTFLNTSSAQTNPQDEYDTLYINQKIKLIPLHNNHKEYKKGDIDWYISPLALLEPRPTIYLGAEYFIKDRLSIHTDLGYLINLTGRKVLNDSTWANWENGGFGSVGPAILDGSKLNLVIKPEIRWYRKGSSSPNYSFYYGLKLLLRTVHYKKTQIGFEEYFYSTLTDNWTGVGNDVLSNYVVRRNTIGLQFVVGKKDPMFKKGISNLFAGVGVRYIANKPLQKTFNPFDKGDNLLQNLNLEFLDFSQQYKFVTIDFSLGVRFGGKIKR